MGALEATRPRIGGAGVSALDHPKQLGLDQVLRKGGAIDRDEGLFRASPHAVQHARENLLANARFTQEQHRHVGRSGLSQQVSGGTKAGRNTHHVHRQPGRYRLQLCVVGRPVEAIDELLWAEIGSLAAVAVPVLNRPTDQPAVLVSHRPALDFIDDDRPAGKGAAIATSIANRGPAHRFGTDSQRLQVCVGFHRITQQELAIKRTGNRVDAQHPHLQPTQAAQGVHLRADSEGTEHVPLGPHPARQFGVARAFGIADTLERGARHREADRFDKFPPQAPKSGTAHQDRTLIVQPDPALGRRKAQTPDQILDIWRVLAVALPLVDQTRRAKGGVLFGWKCAHGAYVIVNFRFAVYVRLTISSIKRGRQTLCGLPTDSSPPLNDALLPLIGVWHAYCLDERCLSTQPGCHQDVTARRFSSACLGGHVHVGRRSQPGMAWLLALLAGKWVVMLTPWLPPCSGPRRTTHLACWRYQAAGIPRPGFFHRRLSISGSCPRHGGQPSPWKATRQGLIPEPYPRPWQPGAR